MAIILTTSGDEDGIWLQCDLCGQYAVNLGFNKTPQQAMLAEQAMEHNCQD